MLEADSLVAAVPDSSAEVNVKTLDDKLVNLKAEALVDTMADRSALLQ